MAAAQHSRLLFHPQAENDEAGVEAAWRVVEEAQAAGHSRHQPPQPPPSLSRAGAGRGSCLGRQGGPGVTLQAGGGMAGRAVSQGVREELHDVSV